jgi:uncharacterized membrane protein YqjE
MSDAAPPLSEIKSASKRLAERAVLLGENRFRLLLLELEEERARLLQALLFALGLAAFGLLAGVALTIVVLLVFWESHPLLAMSLLTAVYAGAALFFGLRLVRLQKSWEAFSGTLSQLQKDIACLAEILH